MPNISASSYDHFRTCPRMYYWEHVVTLKRTQEEGARRFGTMYHAGLEEWWKAMDGGDVPWRDKDAALVAALNAIAANARHINTDPFEAARAEVMMAAYHARYFELDFESAELDGGTGVETWFSLPLLDERNVEIPGWKISGRRDVVKRFANNKVKPVEHKTTGQEIDAGSDYWLGLSVNTQVSIYIDASQRLGVDTDKMLYDVSRKPGIRPQLATPVEKRQFTAGKGCKECGGRAGGRGGAAKGTGTVMKTITDPESNKKADMLVPCDTCKGTGWLAAPALYAKQRETDEKAIDFKLRVAEEIAEDGDAFFRMVDVTRTPDQIADSRADLVMTTGEIGALVELARKTGDMTGIPARRCFPKATTSCTNMYGRNCDYLPICSGQTDPWNTKLYEIRKKGK